MKTPRFSSPVGLLALSTLTGLAGLTTLPAQAQASGDLLLRARVVSLQAANRDDVPGTDISINDKLIPDLDVSYFFSPNLSAELVLTYPQKHNVSSSAAGGKVGTLKHLPPTLTAQYRFTGLGPWQPYVGAGLNYTRFSSVHLAGGALTVEKSSFGLATQLGVDYVISPRWSLNLDVKKVQIRTDLQTAAGASLGTLKVDPWLFGVGVGYRF